MKKKFIIFLIIIGLVVYFNSLFNGFVWDDEEQIVNNTFVHSIANIPQFFKGSTFNTGGTGGLGGTYYRPVMMIVFSFVYQFFGAHPFPFHLFQLFIHAANAILIFYLFLNLGLAEITAFFLAAVFLVHPANVETVAYVSAIQDTLYVFFGLLAINLVVLNKKDELKKILIVGLFLFLGLLTKEVAISFIFLILFYLFIYRKNNIANYIVLFSLVVGFYLILRLGIANIFFTKFYFAPIVQASLKTRLFMTPMIFFYYLKLFFFPKDLAVMQHWIINRINLESFYIPLFFTTLFFIFIYFYYKRIKQINQSITNSFLLFLFWFLIFIFPYLQIFALDMTVAERWFYSPIIGLLGIVGVIFNFQFSHLRQGFGGQAIFKKTIPIFILIIILFSIRTIVRNFDWKNGLILFGHDIQISKNSFDLENNLGVELFRVGRINEAKNHFENSTKLAPSWWVNWNNLGAVYERKGELDNAEEFYKKALKNGDYYLAYENYALLFVKQKKEIEAREFLEKEALKKFPLNQRLTNLYLYLTK